MVRRGLLNKLLYALRITRQPVVRVYDGYGDADEVIVYGHVLRLSPLPRKHYRGSVIFNLLALVRLFIVRPIRNARVVIEWNGEEREAFTDNEGLFRFEWKPGRPIVAGWQKAVVRYEPSPGSDFISHGECYVFCPHVYQYNFISDIDDTFLISHSASILKRLRVLFTKNARTRQPFEDVVKHYQLLARAGAATRDNNPFFYVSSSEWNLYDYIREFCAKEKLPRGVLLLSSMKRVSQLLQTGQTKHTTKYIRIARILKSYPHHKYVLLGDNSQKDPEIYASVVRDFPGKIAAVYIRNVRRLNDAVTRRHIAFIEGAGVACCYFSHSSQAIIHSAKVGLIDISES